MVESTDTRQSISPRASAATCSAVNTLSQVPSLQNSYWRFHTVCHGPNSAGRSRHATPVRSRKIAPSISGRYGALGRPIRPSSGGSNGSICTHISSVNTSVRDMGAASSPEHAQHRRHALVFPLPS